MNVKTDNHIHTMFSDGRPSIGEILEEAIERGLEEIKLVDHCNPVEDKVNTELN